MELDPVNSVAYCGLFCDACRIRQGKVKDAVTNLRDTIALFGIEKSVPELANWEPSFKHYGEFQQVMDGLVKIFGYCAGCLANGGDPNCKVRQCAKQKGFRTCTECDEAKSCQKLDPYRKFFEPALQSVKDEGIKEYAEKMRAKVEKGYSYSAELNSPP